MAARWSRAVLRGACVTLPVKLVHASENKVGAGRAGVDLVRERRALFAGSFPELEDELCGLLIGGDYVGPGPKPGPGRRDGLGDDRVAARQGCGASRACSGSKGKKRPTPEGPAGSFRRGCLKGGVFFAPAQRLCKCEGACYGCRKCICELPRETPAAFDGDRGVRPDRPGCGSVKAAAEALALSSPALTRRIQALERHLGRPLFERRHQSVHLNPRRRATAGRGRAGDRRAGAGDGARHRRDAS